MHDPKAIAAEWYLGGLNSEDLPKLACDALEQGYDGNRLRQLAGLVKPTKRDVEGIVDGAFRELGVAAPLSKDEAALFLVRSKAEASAKSDTGSVEITAHNLVDRLLVALPELEKPYVEKVKSFCGPLGNYLVVATVWKPALKEQIAKGELTDFVHRSLSFVEGVCSSGDAEAINVLWLEIFEWLVHSPRELNFLWPILGPATKAKVNYVAFRRGETNNLPKAIPKVRWWSAFLRKPF